MDSKLIMVVDDNRDLREALSDYLGKAGFAVVGAENGQRMWQKLQQCQPDLIVLDIMMPGEDGFSLCQKLRRHSDVPIIMLTAVAEEADRVAGLEMGADDYITKSFSPRELQLERLYEPYFRADTLTEGNGLGLTISQSIVKAHGGELKLRLSMRGGLIATLSFPREML